MKTNITKKQTGFYFETSEDLAQVKTKDFFWTKKRNNATDRNHALLIRVDESWSGRYFDSFTKDFYIDESEISFM